MHENTQQEHGKIVDYAEIFSKYMSKSAIIVANITLCFVALMMIMMEPSTDGRYAVIAWPGSGETAAFDIVAAADGTIIAPGGMALSVVAQSNAPDFRARLWTAGAFLIINPLLVGGCRTPH